MSTMASTDSESSEAKGLDAEHAAPENAVADKAEAEAEASDSDVEEPSPPPLAEKNKEMMMMRQESKQFGGTLTLDSLNVVRELGTGSFAKVSLVVNPESGKVYALKALNKDVIQEHHQEERVILERAALFHCDSNFVMRLYKTFVDESRVYLLTEFLQGGDLACRVHTARRDGVSVKDAKFYAALTLLGLGYMHEKGYAHRDIRPENIMLDVLGYSKIIDLGFAKLVGDRTFTLCGAHEYVPPEIVSGVGHNRGVDYWAFGVVIFELIAGTTPFLAEDRDPHQTMANICSGRLNFPDNFPTDAAHLIRGLLRERSDRRLGMQRGGYRDIVNHPWFGNTDFDALQRKLVHAPWVPQVKGPIDASYVCRYQIDRVFDDAQPIQTEWEWNFRM